MICHIIFESDYSFAFQNLIKRYFDINEHVFLIAGRATWDPAKQFSYCNSVRVTDFYSPEITQIVNNSSQIIIHGLFFRDVVDFFSHNAYLLKKTCWMIWGGDLYAYRMTGTAEFPSDYEDKRKFIIQNISRIACILEEDFLLAQQIYDTRAERFAAFYPLLNDYEYLNSIRKSCVSFENLTVQIGNSATVENCHAEALQLISHFKNEQIKICCPLSYGNTDYAEQVIQLGRNIFGDNFVPITNVLPIKEYSDFLNLVDIAVMNHNRQQGLGNTFALLYLGKKVYLRSDTTSYSFLTNIGIKIFGIEELATSSFATFTDFSENDAINNIRIIGMEFSEERCAERWKSIFEATDTIRVNTFHDPKAKIQTLKERYFPDSTFIGPYEQAGHILSVYEEQWLWSHRSLISGLVLDMSTPRYWHNYLYSLESVQKVVISEMGSSTTEKYGEMSHADIIVDFCDSNLPISPQTFDTILCLSILEHCTDPFAMVSTLFNIIKPGGTVFLWAPFAYIDGHLEPDNLRFGRDGFRLLAKKAGFEIIEEGNFGDLGEEFGIDASAKNGHRGITCANWIICKRPSVTWGKIAHDDCIKLYAGDCPDLQEYNGWIGLSLTQQNNRHIQHDITLPFPLPDNWVSSFQAEDVFEHIPYERLVPVVNEIFRVLKPGALFRLSVPDYGCDVLRERSEKDPLGNIVFDPGGGGTPEDPGHVWFPRIENVYRLLEKTHFFSNGEIEFLQYWNMDNFTFVAKPIDYSQGVVRRTPDFDERVKNPYRPMSLVVDLRKGPHTWQRTRSNILAYPYDWQYPVITEQHAYERVCEAFPDEAAVIYVGFPWATVIDLIQRGRSDKAQAYLGMLQQIPHDNAAFRITVAQHISVDRFQKLFELAGITDIFWPHATHDLPRLGGIRIHPFPLFPVRCLDEPELVEQGGKALHARTYLYSFVGAYDPSCYLTDVRRWIAELPCPDDALILNRNEWHYEKVVYEEQVLGVAVNAEKQQQLDNEADSYRKVLEETVFSLCPSGSGPNSIRLWESLGYGCIPVILSDRLSLPGSIEEWREAAVFVCEDKQAIDMLPQQLRALAVDKDAINRYHLAGRKLWEKYGYKCFIHDLLQFTVQAGNGISSGNHSGIYKRLFPTESSTIDVGIGGKCYIPKQVPPARSEMNTNIFPESSLAHQWLDGFQGLEIGPSTHNPFGLNTRNVGVLDEIYEMEQLSIVGTAAHLDIVTRADDIPLPDESEDFILSSHVIEHCPNLIKTLVEWFRIVKRGGYLFMIVPHRDATPSDMGRPLTEWHHVLTDFNEKTTELTEPEAGKFGHCHYHVFSIETMKDFINCIFGSRLVLVDSQDIDDKLGNGFTLVYRKERSNSESFPWEFAPQGGNTVSHYSETILVSAIVSTYNSEAFIRGCLADLVEQTLYKKGMLEIIVVDSASPQCEGKIVKEFQDRFLNITYIRTDLRETIYQAWNRGILAAHGKYVTNANTDDRHRPDALEVMAATLDANPQVALVYSDVFVTNLPNQSFSEHIRCGYHLRPDFTTEIMLSGCHMGPQPMWRKSLHEHIGWFHEKLSSAGDYEFWCRIALHDPLLHLPDFLGLYYENPKGFCNADIGLSTQETVLVEQAYRGKFPAPQRSYTNNLQYTGPAESNRFVNIGMTTYNRLEFTRLAIEALLLNTDFPYVLTVVDNASTDSTREYLHEQKRKGIIRHLVLLDENVGVAKASNLAWSLEPEADYYLKLDNDIVIQKPGWLKQMADAIDRIPVLGAIAYNFETDSYLLQEAYGCCLRPKKGNLGGACILIPRRTRERLGVWCEDYGLYSEEDADYGRRIISAGLINAYMEDEHIGLHLPAGRAAAIDATTFTAADGVEEEMHSDYRQWKDDQRRKAIGSGLLGRNFTRYANDPSSLYVESHFAADWLLHHRPSEEQLFSQSAGISSTQKLKSIPRIGILCSDPLTCSCPVIRVVSPLEYLQDRGTLTYVDISPLLQGTRESLMNKLQEFDILVVQRDVCWNVPYTSLKPLLDKTRIKLVFEFDDAMTSLPTSNPHYEHYMSRRHLFEDYIRNADLVTVSTPYLKEIYSANNSKIQVLPNYIDTKIWPSWHMKHNVASIPLKILFSGTPTHVADFNIVLKAIVRILEEFQDGVELYLWGNKIPALFGHPRVHYVEEYVCEYGEYARILQNLNADIGLIPLEINTFNMAKSAIKWLEYSACGIASICSDIDAYNRIVSNGNTGLLVSNDESNWYEAIKSLVLNNELRIRIAENAQQDVATNYTIETNADKWIETYNRLLNKPSHANNHEQKVFTSSTLKVSIIIPVFNQLSYTVRCLETLYAVTSANANFEVIVVDNASTDGTAEFLFQATQRYGNLRIIQNKENLLFAKACNQGGEAAHGGYLVFLNNDTVVTPDWLEVMIEVCQPNVGIVGIRMLYPDGTIQHAGIELINGTPDHPYRHQPADMPAANIPRDLDMVTGACLLISRDLFLQLGGFDEVYRNGVEDVDLCLRVREAGYRVLYQPKAMIYHHEGQSSGRFDHVDQNLRFFINRWQGKFDEKGCFITANPPLIMAAEKSYLIDQRLHIVWQGSQFVYHSLALVNRELCQRLIQIGHELSIVPYEPDKFVVEPESPLATIQKCVNRPLSQRPDVVVRHQWPPDFNPPPAGHWVMIQPWEFGSLPQSWIMPMNDEVDEIWVPSSFVRECYIQSGVSADKVFVVPNGVDASLYSPDGTTYPVASGKSFRFLFVGGTIYRKGIDLLLAAYRQSFTSKDDVCLVIKDMGGKSFYQGQTAQEMIQRFSADPSAPEIVYIDGNLTQDEMAALYRSCHCLVHPYRGEGFGLPIAEAMACGLAPIVTGYGAALDFCPPEYAWLIPAKIVKQAVKQIGDLETVDFPWLAEPDLEMLTTLMRYAAAHSQETAGLGGCASRFIRNNFTWKQAADRADERLRAVTNKPIQRFVALACEKHHETTSGFVSPVKINSKFDMPLNPKEPTGIYDRLTEGGKESVSLCMIVKNEEDNLAACLASIQPIVHEIIIVDTGSKDRTIDIAQAHGAKIFKFTWNGNFSDARNYAIKQAKGNWIFVMDADEVFSELDYDAFRSVCTRSKGKKLAWAVTTRNYMADSMQHGWTANIGEYPQEEQGIGWCPSPKTRLFPRNKRIRFAGPVHEVVEHSLKRLKIPVLPAPFVVHHYGHLNKTGIESKKQQYYELAKMKVLSRSDDPEALTELAIQAGEVGRFEEALGLWDRVLNIRQNDKQAHFNRSHVLNHLKQYAESMKSAKQALKIDPAMKEAAFYYATGELYAGDLLQAEAELLRIIAIHHAYPPAVALLIVVRLCRGDSATTEELVTSLKQINFSINKFLVDCIRKLADVRRMDFARNLLQLSVKIGCLPKVALVELGGCTVAQGQPETVDVLTNRTHDDESALRSAIKDRAISEAYRLTMRGETDSAIEELLQKGIRVSKDDPAPYLALIDILLTNKRFQDAWQVIPEMPETTPAATILALQAVCQEGMGEYDCARQSAEAALDMEPKNWQSLNVLGLIAQRNGTLDVAAEYFERAMKADPCAAEPAANRGVIWWETGKQQFGYELLHSAVTLALRDKEIFRRYRAAAVVLGRAEEAERLFRDKLSHYPESRLLIISLVETLITQRKTSEALDVVLVALSTLGADGELLDGALELRRQVGPRKPMIEGEQLSVSLCMIVKNEVDNLPRCLASLMPVVQEMVIVDTGSSDRSVDIATAFGAQTYNFSWTGSFSDARNFALSKAQGQWILVMDADEVLATRDYEDLRRTVKHNGNKTIAWSVLTRNYTTRVNTQGWTPNDHIYSVEERADGWHASRKVRLFPNDRQIRFRGVVHERVEHDLRQLDYTISPASFVVHHYGELFGLPEEFANKLHRYFDQGKQKLAEQPNDVIALTELAIQAGELELFDEALTLWDKVLALQPDTVEALFNKGYALIGLKRYQEGLDASRRALKCDPDHKEAAFNFGTCALFTDDPYSAIAVVAPVLARHPDYPLLLALLTVLYLVTGQHDRARTTYMELKSLNYAIADYIRDRAIDLDIVGHNEMAQHLRNGGMLLGIDPSLVGGTSE